MADKQSTPEGADDTLIVRRNIHFGVEDASHPAWIVGEPYRTAYCDALSLLFPEGERFFLKAVRHYRNQITDPDFLRAIDDFCVQEAYHTREHEAYNRGLAAQGLDTEAMEALARATLNRVKTPLERLIVTACIEHMTACFAHLILGDPKIFGKAPEAYREMWTWHALEEMEHKGVAFDVLAVALSGLPAWKRYLFRCLPLLRVTYDLHVVLFTNTVRILRARGERLTWRFVPTVLWILFGAPGYYRRMGWHFLSYFLPGFHPWRGDDGSLARAWRDHFNRRAAETAATKAKPDSAHGAAPTPDVSEAQHA